MYREYVIWHIAKREGYRLKRRAMVARLINARFNVAVYHLNGIAAAEENRGVFGAPESRENSPDAQHR